MFARENVDAGNEEEEIRVSVVCEGWRYGGSGRGGSFREDCVPVNGRLVVWERGENLCGGCVGQGCAPREYLNVECSQRDLGCAGNEVSLVGVVMGH